MCVEIVFLAFGCSMQTVHLSCINISTISKQTEPNIYFSLFLDYGALGANYALWGYKPLYHHGSTWAAPSEMARPTR